MNFDGIILIDKPTGWSSFDVVAKIRGILSREYEQTFGLKKKIKVGHTGTLDPLATGLMIVVVGSYCKRAQEFSKLDKTYEVSMKLGEVSTTGDEEGQKTVVSEHNPSEKEIKVALTSFLGQSMQTPPAFSAVKVDGKRAYKLAREGKTVKIKPRKITIHSIELRKYDYPYVNFMVHVGSGTYIRSLVEDIGEKLGVGAYIASLRRTKVATFDIAEARNVESVTASLIRQNDLT